MWTPPEGKLSPLTVQQMTLLMDGLDGNRIAKIKGKSFSYLEQWDIRRVLIRVFGFGGFDVINTGTEIVKIETDVPRSGGGTVNFRVTVMVSTMLRIHQTGTVYVGAAACTQTGAVLGDVTDFAIKTAESDAMKRCAINLGTQFGLSLYNNGNRYDVVEWSVAQGQGWFGGKPLVPMEVTGAVGEPVAQEARTLEEAEEGQPNPAGATSAPPRQPLAYGNGLTEEQKKANQDLLNRGLMMAQEKQDQQ